METKVFYSEFNKDVLVCVVSKTDSRYKRFKPIFDQYGFGFVMSYADMAIIDGGVGLDNDVLKWVEAHEIAHVILGHTEERNAEDELEADKLAYEMLNDKGYIKSAELVKTHSIERHGYQI